MDCGYIILVSLKYYCIARGRLGGEVELDTRHSVETQNRIYVGIYSQLVTVSDTEL